MPDTLIKAYAREAMWAGGTLIVRGIPAGMTIQQFVNSIGGPLVRNKGRQRVAANRPDHRLP